MVQLLKEKHFFAVTILLELAVINPYSSQSVVCELETKPVTPHLVLLFQSTISPQWDSTVDCDLGVEGGGVGVMARSGDVVGVISALVGSPAHSNSSSWLVAVFTTLDQHSLTTFQEWTFENTTCWFELQEGLGFDGPFPLVLDVGDEFSFQVASVLVSDFSVNSSRPLFANLTEEAMETLVPPHLGDITISFEDASLFDYVSSVSRETNMQTVSLDIRQRPGFSSGQATLVTFQLVSCPLFCSLCNISVVVHSDCPDGKELLFSYPLPLNETTLKELPVNYRPPSSRGVGISTSTHVYNADPSQAFSANQLALSTVAVYKQCLGKLSRADCNCLPEQAVSSDISETDCIQNVYRHLFANVFPLTFILGPNAGTDKQLDSLALSIEELNNRTDYQVVTTPPKEIVFNGGGLYHFQGTFASLPSFCSVTTRFTVFVEKEPLKKSEEEIIGSLTATACGLTLLLAYFLHSKKSTAFLQRLHTLKHPHSRSI